MTGSVRLRDVTEDDLPVFFAHQQDPDACRMAAFSPREEEAFKAHWARILADAAVRKHAVLLDDQLVGNIASYLHEGKREVGYWIGKEHWGKGIATRALSAFLLLDNECPIFAHVAKQNPASKRVLEKCGFETIGEDSWTPTGDGEVVEEYILILR
jgi:RimJ/RimL family protein N-acetyltransferase